MLTHKGFVHVQEMGQGCKILITLTTFKNVKIGGTTNKIMRDFIIWAAGEANLWQWNWTIPLSYTVNHFRCILNSTVKFKDLLAVEEALCPSYIVFKVFRSELIETVDESW